MDTFWQKSVAGLSLEPAGSGLGETETDGATDGATDEEEVMAAPGSNPKVVGFGHYSGSYNPFKRSGFSPDYGTVFPDLSLILTHFSRISTAF